MPTNSLKSRRAKMAINWSGLLYLHAETITIGPHKCNNTAHNLSKYEHYIPLYTAAPCSYREIKLSVFSIIVLSDQARCISDCEQAPCTYQTIDCTTFTALNDNVMWVVQYMIDRVYGTANLGSKSSNNNTSLCA